MCQMWSVQERESQQILPQVPLDQTPPVHSESDCCQLENTRKKGVNAISGAECEINIECPIKITMKHSVLFKPMTLF